MTLCPYCGISVDEQAETCMACGRPVTFVGTDGPILASKGLGIVCADCQAFNALDRTRCIACDAILITYPAGAREKRDIPEEKGIKPQDNDMDNIDDWADDSKKPERSEHLEDMIGKANKNNVQPIQDEAFEDTAPPTGIKAAIKKTCAKCGSQLLDKFKFCGNCGQPVAPKKEAMQETMFFGKFQAPGKAKLVLIKGEGVGGLSYNLNSKEHIVGRTDGTILFPEDRYLSPHHANFFYYQDKLFIRDEGSLNGVYIRVGRPIDLHHGDFLLVGEELFRFEILREAMQKPFFDEEGTVFYGSPTSAECPFNLVQILVSGVKGRVFHPQKQEVFIGREGCDLNFPEDQFMSASHCAISVKGENYQIRDLASKNGTFLRIRDDWELIHGDYIFIGQQLLRVEIS